MTVKLSMNYGSLDSRLQSLRIRVKMTPFLNLYNFSLEVMQNSVFNRWKIYFREKEIPMSKLGRIFLRAVFTSSGADA